MDSHIDDTIKAKGKNTFEKSRYDALRAYIQELQDSPIDFSDTLMNIQGPIPEIADASEEPPLGALTVSEYINDQADISELEAAEISVEDAFTSWEAGALEALKK